MLVDADCYFRAVRSAILAAQHSIFILSWDIDSRMRLIPGGANDGYPEELGDFLHAVVSENASFGTVDITDFYLGSPMPSPEFLKLPTSDYHPDLLDDLGITPFIQLDRTGKPKSTKLFPAFLKPGSMPITNLLPIYSSTAISKPPPLPFFGICRMISRFV